MKFVRYGVYFTPDPGGFARAGAQWLGWDIASGLAIPSPEPELTQRPRKYGFHATIKPPFTLAQGQDLDSLRDGMATLCAAHHPVIIDGLEIKLIGSFLAFTTMGSNVRLAALAACAVRDLDLFRAPPSMEELERRRQAALSPQQEDNLVRWGYPHVMDSFRFHMTLTGPVPRQDRDRAIWQARQHFADVVPDPVVIESLTLVGESQSKFFQEIERFPLSKS